jgi:hypothetical protein
MEAGMPSLYPAFCYLLDICRPKVRSQYFLFISLFYFLAVLLFVCFVVLGFFEIDSHELFAQDGLFPTTILLISAS